MPISSPGLHARWRTCSLASLMDLVGWRRGGVRSPPASGSGQRQPMVGVRPAGGSCISAHRDVSYGARRINPASLLLFPPGLRVGQVGAACAPPSEPTPRRSPPHATSRCPICSRFTWADGMLGYFFFFFWVCFLCVSVWRLCASASQLPLSWLGGRSGRGGPRPSFRVEPRFCLHKPSTTETNSADAFGSSGVPMVCLGGPWRKLRCLDS